MKFAEMLEDLRSTTSSKEKISILKEGLNDPENGEFSRFLIVHAYDPTILHNVKLTQKDIPPEGDKFLEDRKREVETVLNGLETCYSSKWNKNALKVLMTGFYREDQEALMGVVNKNFRVGVSVKTINKACPDLIEVIPIQLAMKFNPEKDYKEDYWYWSCKMDGMRVFARYINNEVKLFSRAKDVMGSEIITLEHWKPYIKEFMLENGFNFLDGEAYRHGMKFEEIQSLVSSKVNKKDTTRLKYYIFSAGFLQLTGSKPRLSVFNPGKIRERLFASEYRYLIGVSQSKIRPTEIVDALGVAINSGYEGIMLRSPTIKYSFGRDHYLLKLKSADVYSTEETIDCHVEDLEYGDFIVREDGVETIEHLPVRLLVVMVDDPTTRQMAVGSGLSLQNRRDWKEDESRILYKTIEVECQGFGAHGRMRFPRFKRIREDV